MDTKEIRNLLINEARSLLHSSPGSYPAYEKALCDLIAHVQFKLNLASDYYEVEAKILSQKIGANWAKTFEGPFPNSL